MTFLGNNVPWKKFPWKKNSLEKKILGKKFLVKKFLGKRIPWKKIPWNAIPWKNISLLGRIAHAFTKIAITFDRLNRFYRMIACLKGHSISVYSTFLEILNFTLLKFFEWSKFVQILK
jgi:hypothetical protein